jgi:anti-anti-sigma regulatory factor
VTEAESRTAPDVRASASKVRRRSVASLQGAAPVRSTSVLFCDVNVRTPIAEIRLSGDLTEDTVADLGSELAALIRTGHQHLIVDGHGLSRVSPACAGALNRAAAGLGQIGGELIVTGLGSTDAHRLRSAGLHSAIQLGVDADHWLTSASNPRNDITQPKEIRHQHHRQSKGQGARGRRQGQGKGRSSHQ